MGVRAEMAADRADEREREERQADEDVRAVQARQPEEGRRERVVAGPEADPRVFARLDQEEREAEQERERQARDEARAILDRKSVV